MTKEELNQLDDQIASIQRSTKTTFKSFIAFHEKLRMKYRWYYS